MNTVIPTLKLHTNRRLFSFYIPLIILAIVALVSVVISLLFWRSGSQPGSPDWIMGSQSNPGLLYSYAGFFGALGVTTVSTTFPFALSLGATRRGFTGGTFIWQILISAYLTVMLGVLMLLEVATGHWFSNFYIFDITILGAGNLAQLIPNVFLGTLTILAISSFFGASWLRLGSRGPQLVALGFVLIVLVALIIFIPSASEIFKAFQLWWLGALSLATILLCSVGTWLFLRPVTVR
ncbi:hypothetical protein [Lysinibacter sp. HNR]|uniref:hypothetical protein n=1 Tax=Lysinibacter sp. HNR TaxID=3031408 RepID=UPI002434EBEA|nr:hypothetical protein [Lysinibacter sp. HNR]WGD36690.1 hypothetical protein FrondiHNR_09500 [Lysinibacter sp. HNR]